MVISSKRCTLLSAVLIGLFSAISAADTVRITTITDNPLTPLGMRIMSHAYGELGYDVQYIEAPSARSLELLDSGLADAELGRIDGQQLEYHNLVKIPVSLTMIRIGAFTHRHDVTEASWESLKNLRLGVVRGSKFYNSAPSGLTTYFVDRAPQLLDLLMANRIDVAIMEQAVGRYLIKTGGYTGIKQLQGELGHFDVYHYIHKQRKELIPEMTDELTKMEQEGILKRMREEFDQRIQEPSSLN